MDLVEGLRAAGNALYKQADFAAADQKYTEALSFCDGMEAPPAELMLALFNNRSACKLKLSDFPGSLKDAHAALAIDNRSTKALYRSAAALTGWGLPDKLPIAMQMLQQAAALDPRNSEVNSLKRQVEQRLSSTPHSPAAGGQLDPPKGPEPTAASAPNARKDPLPLVPPELLMSQRGGALQYVPSPDGMDGNLLIMLHGLGDKPANYVALARKLSLPQTSVLALAGPIEVEDTDGGRAWFEALEEDWEPIKPSRTEQRRIRSLAKTRSLMCRFIDQVVQAGLWQHSQVSLFGFSQGGCTALEVHRQFSGQRALGGCISIAGALLEESIWAEQGGVQGLPKGIGPVLVTLGEKDEVTSRESVSMTLRHLQSAQAPKACSLHTVPGKGHAMLGQGTSAGAAGVAAAGSPAQAEVRECMGFWAATLHRSLPAQAMEGCVEVRPGVCEVERVG